MISITECQLLSKNKSLSIEHLGYLKSGGHALRLLNFFNTQSVTSFFFSHARIAFYTRMSISSVKRALKELKWLGLIQWRRRYNKTCIYILHLSTEFKQKFTTYMRTFFALSLSFVISKDRLLASDLLIKNKEFNFILNPNPERVSQRPGIGEKEKDIHKNKEHPVNTQVRDEYIAQINKQLPLSTHGLIKLRQFPWQALKFGFERIKYCKAGDNPFLCLLSFCAKFCAKYKELPINREFYNQERIRLGIDVLDDNFLDLEKLAALQSVSTLKQERTISKPQSNMPGIRTEKMLNEDSRLQELRQYQDQLASKKELSWFEQCVLQIV
jgi:hypothetical protein